MGVIDRVALLYGTCHSYMDTGTVHTVGLHYASGTEIRQELSFETAFLRPNRFRFQFSKNFSDQHGYRRVTCMNDEVVRTWWDVDDSLPAPPSLHLALAGVAGVSRHSSLMVPRLLLPDLVIGRNIGGLTDVEEFQGETIADAPWRAFRAFYGSTPVRVWVEADSLLIQRIALKIANAETSAEHVIDYRPSINCAISPEQLDCG